MDTLVELFKSADAKKAYEELLEELTAGFDRRLKTGETTSNTGAKSKSQAADDSEARARIVLQTYTPELMQFRNPGRARRMPGGLSRDLRRLSRSLKLAAERAGRTWNDLPPGPRGAMTFLGRWIQETLVVAELLGEKNWIPSSISRWDVVDEVLWGLLKTVKKITGRYHYLLVADLASHCLDDPDQRCNAISLKMIVHRRKRREAQFLRALLKVK